MINLLSNKIFECVHCSFYTSQTVNSKRVVSSRFRIQHGCQWCHRHPWSKLRDFFSSTLEKFFIFIGIECNLYCFGVYTMPIGRATISSLLKGQVNWEFPISKLWKNNIFYGIGNTCSIIFLYQLYIKWRNAA